jgi:general secretion pathway protein M
VISWIKAHQRSAIICGLTLLLPLLLYLNLVFSAWGMRAEYAGEIERLTPRIARLAGVQQVEEILRESAGVVQQRMSRLVYPASAERASVAASMQTDVRQLMTDAGLTVSNSQVMPVREEERFDFIGVKLTVAGDMGSLDRALAELADFTPLIIIEGLDIWPTRTRRNQGEPEAQEATVSIRLLSLRSAI